MECLELSNSILKVGGSVVEVGVIGRWVGVMSSWGSWFEIEICVHIIFNIIVNHF